MWKSALRMGLSMAAFTINVQVKADDRQVIVDPVGCHVTQSLPCTYFVKGHSFFANFENYKLRLSKGTSFTRENENTLRLVSGEVLVETNSEVTIESLYGKMLVKDGRGLLKSDNSQAQVYALKGVVKYHPRGYVGPEFLPVGFVNFMGRVGPDGLAKTGYPKAAELNKLLPAWASFFTQKDKQELEEQVSEYRKPWVTAVNQVGDWYLSTVKRQIAALKEERRRERIRRLQIFKEESYFRDMFRRKNFID